VRKWRENATRQQTKLRQRAREATTTNTDSPCFDQKMPGPIRNSFMRNWWAVEVRIPSLPIEKKRVIRGAYRYLVRPFRCELCHRMHPSTAGNMTLSCSYCVVGATVLGCGWYLTRLARGPHGEPLRLHTIPISLTVPNYFSEFLRHIVVWTKSNPTPWNEVKQDENVKMMAVNQKFDKRYVYVPLLLASLAPHR
jgi:NADH-ubiquinone reductase complex 1 MLRQ subunit